MSEPQNNPDTNASPSETSSQVNHVSSVVWWVLTIAVGVFLVAWMVLPRRPDAGPAVGKPAPQISVVSLGETTSPLDPPADPSSTVTLLHFWGTWCGPCRQEYPELVSTAQQLESTHPTFRFVSVSCEPPVGNNTLETLRESTDAYYRDISVDVPTYCDPQGRSRAAAAEVLERPAIYYPTTILIGPDGKVAAVWEGYSPSGVDQMREAIEALLDAAS